MKEDRITELDLLRCIGVLVMLLQHTLYDLSLFGFSVDNPAFFSAVFAADAKLFIVLSGICSRFSRNPVKRGLIVLAAGTAVAICTSAASEIIRDPCIRIQFGMLQLLGCCMLLSPLFKRFSYQQTFFFGIIILVAGIIADTSCCSFPFLYPLGFHTADFISADYEPVLPGLGWFLLGRSAGFVLYPCRQPVFPSLQGRFHFPAYIGKHTLLIYLLHQPLILSVLLLLTQIPV